MIDSIYNNLKDYILSQRDFKELFDKCNATEMNFEEAVIETCRWVCLEENLPSYMLDKQYLDISWLLVDDCLINMDDVWEYFKIIITGQ